MHSTACEIHCCLNEGTGEGHFQRLKKRFHGSSHVFLAVADDCARKSKVETEQPSLTFLPLFRLEGIKLKASPQCLLN